MPQKKRSLPFDRVKAMLYGVVVGLFVITVSLMVVRRVENTPQVVPLASRVSLGAMQYDFSSGKAVKRSDETMKNLQAFLFETAKKDTSTNCLSYYNVVAANDDETQIFLKYGCDYPSAPMFAVRDGNSWHTITPTNHFDMFNIPECGYVNENHIATTLAPVCFNQADGTSTYSVR